MSYNELKFQYKERYNILKKCYDFDDLRNKSKKRNQSIFDRMNVVDEDDIQRKQKKWKKVYEESLANDDKTLYEKYHLNRKAKNKKSVFEEEIDEDPFFMDPNNENDKKKLKQSLEDASSIVERHTGLHNHNKSGFKPYEVRTFYAGGDVQKFRAVDFELKNAYGKKYWTPDKAKQQSLDRKGWKLNINFIPIAPSKNKLLIKEEKMKEEKLKEENSNSEKGVEIEKGEMSKTKNVSVKNKKKNKKIKDLDEKKGDDSIKHMNEIKEKKRNIVITEESKKELKSFFEEKPKATHLKFDKKKKKKRKSQKQ